MPRPPRTRTRPTGNARLRAVFDTAVEGIVIIDEQGVIDEVNPAAERMFGWAAGQLRGRNVSILMPEPYRSAHDGYLATYRATGHRKIIGIGREVFGRHRLGKIFPIDLSVGEFVDGERRMFTGIIRDVTERRRLQAEVLRIAEMEQRRIGRDLHDDLCQQLAGIEFLSQSLALRLAEAGRPEASAAAEVNRLVREATEHTRHLSHGMSPLALETHGLPDVLAALAQRTAKRFGLKVDLNLAIEGVRFGNQEVSIHLYRIAQEAVQNAVKHARATRLEIGLATSSNRLHLVVRDNGRGLPARLPRSGGLGLRIMQYRAGMIGASLAVQRDPAGGTVVTCSVDTRVAALDPKPSSSHEKASQGRRPPGAHPARR